MTELVEIDDLPDLELIGRRWAVLAALTTAVLGPGQVQAQPHGWFFDDGGGSWSQVVLLADGRAVLVGMDRDYSATYRAGIDLRDGLPFWCLPFLPVPGPDGDRPWWGFVFLYDGTSWWAPYVGVEDGLADHLLPVLTEEEMLSAAAEWVDSADQEGLLVAALGDPGDRLDRAVELGPDLTTEALFDLLPVAPERLAAGIAAARTFAEVTAAPGGARDLPYPIGR